MCVKRGATRGLLQPTSGSLLATRGSLLATPGSQFAGNGGSGSARAATSGLLLALQQERCRLLPQSYIYSPSSEPVANESMD